jgi:hypothetical protein
MATLNLKSCGSSTLRLFCGLLLVIVLAACVRKDKEPVAFANMADPRWVERSTPNAQVAVVFVHGLFGDTLGSWTGADGKTFFDYLSATPEIGSQVDIFAFGFTSNMFESGSLDIREAANKLNESLEFYKVMDYPALVFVAHSMGGLVVLRHLLNHPGVAERVPLVVLYASPQEGAEIARIATTAANNPALANMFPSDGNIFLQQLSDEWRRLAKRPLVSCGYEKLATHGVMVVPWTSATRFCDDTPAAIEGADHITIVKPDRAEHASVVLLVNALTRYVLGKNFAAKLEMPDFLPSSSGNLTFTMDSRQRKAKLRNAGRVKLRYWISQVSDPALYIVPEDTPRDILGEQTESLTLSLLSGATAKQYRFVLRSDVSPEQLVEVNVPDVRAIDASRAQLSDRIVVELNGFLKVPENAQRLAKASSADTKVLDETMHVIYRAVERDAPGLPPTSNWIFVADALNSMNWPRLAANALGRAQFTSASSAASLSAQRLSKIIASQSEPPSPGAITPLPYEGKTQRLDYLIKSKNRNEAALLATRLQQIPALEPYGLSLEGDVQNLAGNSKAARDAYMKAVSLEPSQSVKSRLMALDATGGSTTAASVSTPVVKSAEKPYKKGEISEPKRDAGKKITPANP